MIAAARRPAGIQPKRAQPAVLGGFTIDDFAVDEHPGTVTYPADVTRQVTAWQSRHLRGRLPHLPLRERCTSPKYGRTLHLHEHDGLLRAARADWAAGPGGGPGLQQAQAPR